MIIDLHTHSYYSSDGKLSIPELLSLYSAGDIVALTDHETIAGWNEFRDEARKKGIIPVLGVEWFLSGCCHILSYFVNEIPQSFYDYMYERREKERYSMKLVYVKAKEQFPNISSYEEIMQTEPSIEKIMGLPVLARHLATVDKKDNCNYESMVRDWKREMPESERPQTFNPEDIIKLIDSWNGISVLAHPFKNSSNKDGRQSWVEVEKKVKELACMGIRGVELYSYGSNLEELGLLLPLARELNLFVSIGSDYHNKEKGLNRSELEGLDESLKNEVVKWLAT
ncbi:MAG: PHP domain-containing protein [Candidatus Acididesulfobacter diazotrophicus]|jgi:hypothetical protein|uniref:PHP domain-containing protein n=1 Tax=Candidatus Acididesulfobacter diazotrophicus TaxID=2597226 RepID=A0A519BJU5_9DELT|nr:MAG: PHP domain-containing protein [Candidatus Acididesulfobacter diazotrophicus]